MTLLALKARGVTLIWCVHNVQPHDASKLFLLLWRFYVGAISILVDGFVTLSPSTLEIVRSKLPRLAAKPGIYVCGIQIYLLPSFCPQIAEARRQRGLQPSDTVFCFFGFAKRYKGLDELIRCFLEFRDQTFHLRDFWFCKFGDIAMAERIMMEDPRIRASLRWLPEAELFEAVFASDVAVLPFKSILHSGSLIYALCCGRPVITPATPYALDIQKMVGVEWVRTYDPPLASDVLVRLSGKQTGKPNLEFLSIHDSGLKLRAFYESFRRDRRYATPAMH